MNPSTINNISIITICFNNLEEVLNTCRSVDIQTTLPFEHLIIDGSTNDEIKTYFSQTLQPAFRKTFHEKDHGIGDAFNKGIAHAQGNILVMLNAGDTFYDASVLKTVHHTFETHPTIQWLHGKYELQRGGLDVIIGKPHDAAKTYRGMRSICHQTMFVKKSLHEKYGLYNNDRKIGMDYDFLLRIQDEAFQFIDAPMVKFAPGGISSSSYLKALKETRNIYETRRGYSFKLVLWQLRLKFLHGLMQSFIGKTLYKIKVMLKLENL